MSAAANALPVSFQNRFDATMYRQAMAHFATGITVATTLGNGDANLPVGVTINSFTSVSLTPPTVLFCLGEHAGTHDAFRDCSHFAINILSASQQAISARFAKPESWPWRTQWQGLDAAEMVRGPQGLPLFTQSLAWLICKRGEVYPGGDHSIILGEVVQLSASDNGQGPLLYHGSQYKRLG